MESSEPNAIEKVPNRFIYQGIKRFYQREPVIYTGSTIKRNEIQRVDSPEYMKTRASFLVQCQKDCNLDESCRGVSFLKTETSEVCELKSALLDSEKRPGDADNDSMVRLDITDNPYAFGDLNILLSFMSGDRSLLLETETRSLLAKIQEQNAKIEGPTSEKPLILFTPPVSDVSAVGVSVTGAPVVPDSTVVALTPAPAPAAEQSTAAGGFKTTSAGVALSVVSGTTGGDPIGTVQPKDKNYFSMANIFMFAILSVVLFFVIKYGVQVSEVNQDTMKNIYVQVGVAILVSAIIVYTVKVK